MSAAEDPKRLQGRARWSHASKCPRMAAMALLGSEPEEPGDRQKGRMQRGKDAQRFFQRERLEPKYGEAGVIPEPAVAWPGPPELPIGEMHPDFFVPAEKMTIEVKSSEAVDSMFDQSLLQAKGQTYWHPEAEVGALVFLDRDYQETDWFPVLVTDDDVEQLEDIATQVVEAGRTGELPERTCLRPQEGVGKFCPFIRECFEGWEPPVVEPRDDLAQIAAEAYLAKRDLKTAEAELKPLVERWDAAKAALLEADLPPGETPAGPITIKRVDVSGSDRMSLSKARKAGLWTEAHSEIFSSFISHTEGHTRWDLRRDDDTPLDLDFGDTVPF